MRNNFFLVTFSFIFFYISHWSPTLLLFTEYVSGNTVHRPRNHFHIIKGVFFTLKHFFTKFSHAMLIVRPWEQITHGREFDTNSQATGCKLQMFSVLLSDHRRVVGFFFIWFSNIHWHAGTLVVPMCMTYYRRTCWISNGFVQTDNNGTKMKTD